MDPLSITTAVVSLAGVCLVTAKRLSDLRSRFNMTSMTLTAILSETTVVSASLGQIQAALLRFSSTFVSQFERHSTLLQTLDTALIGCSVVILALQEEVQQLEVGLFKARNDDQTSSNWLLKMKILWKENTMKELLIQIRGQQASLGFLLQALNMNSMTELHNLMTSSSVMLNQLTENTSKLCKTYPSVRAPLSIFEMDRDDGVSFFSHTASSAGATEFDFDNFLVESKVYRRAFMGGYLKPHLLMDAGSDTEESDTETITGAKDNEEREDTETITYPDSDEDSEFDSMTDIDSQGTSEEAQTDTPNTDLWSGRSAGQCRVLKVKDIDGEYVHMGAEMVEAFLHQHEGLLESYRTLEKQYEVIERTSELQMLQNKRLELQNHILRLTIEKLEQVEAIAKDSVPISLPGIFDTFPSSEQLLEWTTDQQGSSDDVPTDISTSATDVATVAEPFYAANPTAIASVLLTIKPPASLEGDASRSCPICGTCFTGAERWLDFKVPRHIRELHGSRALSANTVSCLLCSTDFSGTQQWRDMAWDKHMRESHGSAAFAISPESETLLR